MQIQYDAAKDLLYISLDSGRPEVVNRRVSEDVVLDVAADNRIVGIEIMEASKRVDLGQLLPIRSQAAA